MSDGLVSNIFVLLFLRGKVLELLLKLLVESLAGFPAFVGHVFAGDGVVGLVSLTFLLSFHKFSALWENRVLSLREIAHVAFVVAQKGAFFSRVLVLLNNF